MPEKGKHRRSNHQRITRGIALAGAASTALALPFFGASIAEATPNTVHSTAKPAAIATAVAAAKAAGPLTYTVVAGDSLSAIAEEHSVSGGWKRLYQDNRRAVGDNPSLIRPGLKLTVVPGPGAAPQEPKKAAASSDRADRSAERTTVAAAAKSYPDNLDGWIREALDIMAQHGIPGSYEGIHRNIMRESSGNPNAINNWDSNAAKGTPSKGLLQTIDPTFRAYHVPGTSMDPFDPVANIVAACNYAADRYGSIDNVNGPY
ncbi:transglycosylase SLT domain-containing protein [Streptomyces sp. HNM0663]|uniref:Transglycosylase SLT domain-containing protein n=1 Tax=Streptomyces chengmaiensis TaxID=3040919 RepID=A0ABT6HPR6_9ACTN|nr:LysM peptidoglycan-binding domain-containing protein [Streptomyces chengmaiensis]MDH2390272.1 transglycosylase SLT domain-containing protein [Streptomyces chengmaiensis]